MVRAATAAGHPHHDHLLLLLGWQHDDLLLQVGRGQGAGQGRAGQGAGGRAGQGRARGRSGQGRAGGSMLGRAGSGAVFVLVANDWRIMALNAK